MLCCTEHFPLKRDILKFDILKFLPTPPKKKPEKKFHLHQLHLLEGQFCTIFELRLGSTQFSQGLLWAGQSTVFGQSYFKGPSKAQILECYVCVREDYFQSRYSLLSPNNLLLTLTKHRGRVFLLFCNFMEICNNC